MKSFWRTRLTAGAVATAGAAALAAAGLAQRSSVLYPAQPAAADARGWLEHEFARLFANIGPSVAADRFTQFDYDEFAQEQSFLLSLARTRPAYLLCQIANGTTSTACPVPGR